MSAVAKKTTPYARAEVLLLEHLDSRQRADYMETRAFNVLGSDGRRYRLYPILFYNVVDEDGVSYCVVPLVEIPTPDRMLAHKLWLQNDVVSYKALAHVAPGYRHARPRYYPPKPQSGPTRGGRAIDRIRALAKARCRVAGAWIDAIGKPHVVMLCIAAVVFVLDTLFFLGVLRL